MCVCSNVLFSCVFRKEVLGISFPVMSSRREYDLGSMAEWRQPSMSVVARCWAFIGDLGATPQERLVFLSQHVVQWLLDSVPDKDKVGLVLPMIPCIPLPMTRLAV